jgi:hypothetical protein
MRDHTLAAISYPLRVVVGMLVYRNVTATLHGQGTLRYSDDELLMFKRDIWQSISDLLAASRAKSSVEDDSRPFWVLGGEEPTDADATLFGALVSILVSTA